MTCRDYSQILQLNGISGNMLKLLNIFRKKWKQVLPNGHGFLWQILVLVSPKVLFLVLFLLIYVNDLSSYLNTKLNTHQTQTHSPNFVTVWNNWLHRDSSLCWSEITLIDLRSDVVAMLWESSENITKL